MNPLAWFSSQPRAVILAELSALVAVVGVLDSATGPELAFTIIYLVPVFLATWYLGARLGLTISVLSSLTWFAADALTAHPYSHPIVPYWNTLVLMGLFCVVAYVASALHAAIHAQEQLAHFIVHDLRSPLAVMQMSLQTLREMTGKDMPERQQRLLEIAIDSTGQMTTLINSLLDLAKLEHGSLKPELEPVPAAELVETAVAHIVAWAENSQVTVETSIAPNAACALADRDLTARVLGNLLTNAIKHSPPQSAIRVEAAPADDGSMSFSVSDRGPGIPPQWLSRIFDKFEQVDARTAGAAAGTGLGLTFCRLAVQAQGGRIWAESDPGTRTTFHFTLPACRL